MSIQHTAFRLKPIAAVTAFAFTCSAFANPLGGQVVNGAATFNQNGNLLTVTNKPGTIINWQSFSINQNETTRFVQQNASSAILNRVIGSDPSKLLGALQSNGKVFLINPEGILVGQGAKIDVASLVASTLSLSNEDFLAGNLNFVSTPNAGNLINQGSITTPNGGTVYLVAPQVENQGIITTPKGETVLAAGNTVKLVDSSTPGVTVEITGSDNQATNLGQILADTGRIGMVATTIKNNGTLNANSMVKQGGRVLLKASGDTIVSGDSKITAIGYGNSSEGGEIQVLGNRVAVMDKASLDVSGTKGGGTILVGGDYHGENSSVPNSSATYIGANASVTANATDKGDGGKVIVWADDVTNAFGNIEAKGGMAGGNGGFVETSGKALNTHGMRVNTNAAKGNSGTWLLDPTSIEIVGGSGTSDLSPASGVFTATSSPNTVTQDDIQTFSQATNIILEASDGITTSGTFTGNTVTLANNRSLTIRTTNDSLGGGGSNGIDLICGGTCTGLTFETRGSGGITLETGYGQSDLNNTYTAPIKIGALKTENGSITVTAIGTVTAYDAIDSDYGNISVQVKDPSSSANLNLTNNSQIHTDGTIKLKSDNMTISGDVEGSTVELVTNTAGRAIALGASDLYDAVALKLASSELHHVEATTLKVGDGDAGNISVVSAITIPTTLPPTTFTITSAGDIAVSDTISKTDTSDTTLTLKAKDDILVSAAITASGSGKLNVTLNSDSDASGSGGIQFNSNAGITSNGGTVTLTDQSTSGMSLAGTGGINAGTNGSINLIADQMSISNTLQASGGTLTIKPYTAGTTIGIAGGTGTLQLSASNFTSQFTDGFSAITVGNSSAGDITLGGTTTLNDNLTLTTNGTILSSGTIDGSGNITLNGTATISGGTLTGTGTFTTAGTTSVTNTVSVNRNWTNSGSLTLSGGKISLINGGITYTNQGTTILTTSNTTPWDVNGGAAIVNSGTMNLNGAYDYTTSNPFTNSSGATINLNSGNLIANTTFTQNGAINIGTSQKFQMSNGTTTVQTNGSFTGTGQILLSGAGTLDVLSGALPRLDMTGGSLTRSTAGNVTISGAFNASGGSITDGGGGSLITSGTSTVTNTVSVNRNWTNSGSLTLSGGKIGLINGGITYTNQGTTTITTSNTTPWDVNGSAAIVNSGTMNFNGAYSYSPSNPFTNSSGATININAGSLIAATDFTQSGTIVLGGGGLTASSGLTNNGTLSGSGTITVGTGASKLVNQGNINPGGTSTAGTLAITGDLQLASGSNLNMELGGTNSGQFDKLTVSGALSGNAGSFGSLTLSKINSFTYTNVSGDDFELMTASSGVNTGTFASLTLANSTLTPTYTATTFNLSAIATQASTSTSTDTTPSLDTCTANPSATGCSSVLPTLSTCTSAPSTAGCTAVLPSITTCTTTPTASGCSAVLPSLATCSTSPSTSGCSAVLPSLAACTTAPSTTGCSAVLPTLANCTSNPSASGCSAVLPSLSACTTAPNTAGCSAVLPTLADCASNPNLSGCSAVLPTVADCTTNPNATGCNTVLDPVVKAVTTTLDDSGLLQQTTASVTSNTPGTDSGNSGIPNIATNLALVPGAPGNGGTGFSNASGEIGGVPGTFGGDEPSPLSSGNGKGNEEGEKDNKEGSSNGDTPKKGEQQDAPAKKC